MICVEATPPRVVARRQVAASRLPVARNMLRACRLCAHDCGVDRTQGAAGLCHAQDRARVFAAGIDVADEMEFIPTFAIALGGCDLRCDFCITGESSWNARSGLDIEPHELAARARAALENGAKSVMILGGEPTIHLPFVLELVSHLPDEARLIFKTNAHGSADARKLLPGLFDVYLADYKFGNNSCALRLAKVPNYLATVHENLRWAAQEMELFIRHLLMPGHLNCCWRPLAEWLAAELPEVKVSLRSGFWPGWQARRHPELRGKNSSNEHAKALAIAHDLGLNLIS